MESSDDDVCRTGRWFQADGGVRERGSRKEESASGEIVDTDFASD
jgi:hypothetical protein